MSCMLLTTVVRIDLGIHEVIILISVFRDEWLLELLVDLRLIVNRSWFWGKTFWMSSVLLSAIMWVDSSLSQRGSIGCGVSRGIS
jgi:hypothetical protein